MTKSKSKKKKSQEAAKNNPKPELKTRKMLRKEKRQEKKRKKVEFFAKRYGKTVPEPVPEPAKPEPTNKPNKEKSKAKQTRDREREAERNRKRKLMQDNEIEEKNMKRLEKQLKMNKRKKKDTLPKSFVEDGLDYLLDVVDSKKLAQGQIQDSDEDDLDLLSDLEADSGSDQEDSMDDNEDMDEEEDDQDSIDDEHEEDLDDFNESNNEDIEHAQDSDEDMADDESENDLDEDVGQPDSDPEEEKEPELREDIYGRLIDSKGILVKKDTNEVTTNITTGKYIPPALRAKMNSDEDSKRKEEMLRLKRKLKGLLNRLAASNMAFIVNQVESLFMSNSRNDVNEAIFGLLKDSLISPVLTPERLVMEHALLIGVLHANVGVEVGASILQSVVEEFHKVYSEQKDLEVDEDENTKELDNFAVLVSHLFTFKVTTCDLVFDLCNLFADNFKRKDVELLLNILKTVGFALRKDDPMALKSLISKVQTKSNEDQELKKDSRTKFMLEVLTAIKNNNVKKIPNYDNEHQIFLTKNMKQWVRASSSSTPLKVNLNDLLNVETRGRWWIVGSAWAGQTGLERPTKPVLEEQKFSSNLLDLAKKMRMSTDTRRNIFCTVMSAEDLLDAFEKVLKLPIKSKKEREVGFVLLDCCLQEKNFNPYYAKLGSKLASADRKYRMSLQFSLWDKIRDLESLKKFQMRNLSKFLHFLITDETLSVACLKVIEFADLDKVTVKFLTAVLTLIFEEESSKVASVFKTISGVPALKTLREGLRLFLGHFMLKSVKEKEDNESLLKNLSIAEAALMKN